MRAKHIVPLLIIAVFLFSFFISTQASAKGLVPCGPGTGVNCNFCHLFELFKNIMDFLLVGFNNNLPIIPTLAVVLLAIGGGMLLLGGSLPGSKDKPGTVQKAKSLFTAVVIGLVIAYSAWLLVNFFFVLIGVQDWTGLKEGWFKVDCELAAPSVTPPVTPPITPPITPPLAGGNCDCMNPTRNGSECANMLSAGIPVKSTNTNPYIDPDLIPKLIKFKECLTGKGITSWRVTEACPPGETHYSSCHMETGRCIDADNVILCQRQTETIQCIREAGFSSFKNECSNTTRGPHFHINY